jgi:hypothetical protein
MKPMYVQPVHTSACLAAGRRVRATFIAGLRLSSARKAEGNADPLEVPVF